MITYHHASGRAMLGSLTAGEGCRRAGRLGTALLVVGLVVGLLPNVAYADFGAPGLNGAQINLSNDGYDGEGLGGNGGSNVRTDVSGKSFKSTDVAKIYQCIAGETDLDNHCQLLAAAPTDLDGAFNGFPLVVQANFTNGENATVNCYGPPGEGRQQCAVVAATFDRGTGQVTSKAEHYICAFPGPPSAACTPDPNAPRTTVPAGKWMSAPPMPTARTFLGAATGHDGRIYTFGGRGGPTAAEVFDPATGKWSSLPPMPTPRTDLAVATGGDGRIYAIGGATDSGARALTSVDAYDPTTNEWAAPGTVAPLNVGRTQLAATTGLDGRIYAIGGTPGGAAGSIPLSVVEAYDPGLNVWLPMPPLAEGRYGLAAATGPDGRIYALGGLPLVYPAGDPPNAEAYSPGPAGTPGVWTPIAAMPTTQTSYVGSTRSLRAYLAATAGPDGRIYTLGGYDTWDGDTASVNAYDPATDAWGAVPPMRAPGRGLAAATGPNGRIYAFGGQDLAESFDPTGTACCAAVNRPPADFDGNGSTDVSVFRPADGIWYVKDGTWAGWGADGDIPMPGDYDGDGSTDIGIFRPSTGLWAIHPSGGGGDTFVTYGISTDVPIVADYDGDGKTDIAIFRPQYGTWWMHHSSDNSDVAITFGIDSDVPVPADYDGDGKADLGIFRDGTWFVQPASGGSYTATNYGAAGDIPSTGDYDGDGKADIAIFRPSNGAWAIHHSSDNSDEAFAYGTNGDIPVPGDYNADGKTDAAIYHPADGTWHVKGILDTQWGNSTDIPLPLPYSVRQAYFGDTG